MAKTVAIKKCDLHEDCQLMSVNGGPWEHTPAHLTVAERMARAEEK